MPQYSEQELLNQIQNLAKDGTPPTAAEFRQCPETAAASVIQRRFGSWNKGVQAAGYEPIKGQCEKQELLGQIQSLASGIQPPSMPEFDNHPETDSSDSVIRHFGSWNKGVRAAGCVPNRGFSDRELMEALQQAASVGDLDQLKDDTGNNPDYPTKGIYCKRLGGVTVAAIRGSIDVDCLYRKRAIPLTEGELRQFNEVLPEVAPHNQAVGLVALLTGCDRTEHTWVGENGIETTKTDPVIIFPAESSRGSRSVSVGNLYNQLVRVFDSISPERLTQSIEFSRYPSPDTQAEVVLRRIAERIEFDVDRPVVGKHNSYSGPQVLHRDLRCTHYLFEYSKGASQAMLKRRLTLSDDEIEHYNRYLDQDEDGWTVAIEWRD